MSKVKNNLVTKGLSGRFGDDIVFRQVNGQTYAVKRPEKPTKTSEKQKQVRMKFQMAQQYAKASMLSPELKSEYSTIAQRKGFKSAVVAAATDYLTETKLVMIFTDLFDGAAGYAIAIVLEDNYKGKNVAVSIANKDGTEMESGNATHTVGDGAWRYRTTASYTDVNGFKISVSVKDRIGNTTQFEKRL